MKRKFVFLLILLVASSWKVFCQNDLDKPTEGYIENAVPPFDNETRQIDWSKVEIKPIIRYQPEQNFIPQRNGNNAVTAIDNPDVHVYPSPVAQSEQHMMVSRRNPDNIILCSNTPYYMGYYVSQDGGNSWFGSDSMPDNIGSGGDPATSTTIDGNLFFETINNSYNGYKVFKSTNGGNTWPGPINFTYTSASFDKQMMAVDNLSGSPYLNNVYTAWTDFNTPYSVRFNRSINGGASYLSNINIHNSWGQGTNVQTGINGEVYVCWANYGTGSAPANGIGFSRSFDGGATFTDLTPAFPYAGIRLLGSDPLFNNTRVADFPSMAVDRSCNFTRGRIYIAYPAKQNGNGKSVILVRSSDNQGTTWSAETEVSITDGRQNWFPWISVDDVTGTVSVAYLSLNETVGFTTNTFLAYSFDGGFSWSNLKVSDVGHTVAAIPGFAGGYCGDYIANSAYANKNYVCWNDNRNGQWQNYVSRVDFSQMALFSSNTDLTIHGPLTYSLPTASNVQYQATGDISTPSGSTLTIQSGANVVMLAGGHSTLLPGFIAQSGSHFVAVKGVINPCINASRSDDNVAENIESLKRYLKPAYDGNPLSQFSIYPNPSNGEINVEYMLTDYSDVKFSLYDLQGREIKALMNNVSQTPGLNNFKGDISSLPNGIYIYKLVTNSYTKSGKFVKGQ
jgi:hypothetical protein